MNKQLLIERIDNSTPLDYIDNSDESTENKHCLGRLRGIGSVYSEPTRNGRRYPRELWEKVLKSESFKEMMETRTCLGELNHPDDRVDGSLRDACMILTEMHLDDEKQAVMVDIEIIDTPYGRLLKELLNCGIKVGISSRGLGDEIPDPKTGGVMIDPETYDFYAYDAVVTPSVMRARPTATESLNRERLSESFHREIENASSINELNSIKHIAEVTNLPELASITEAIDNKLESYNKSGDNISDKLEDDLGRIAQENEQLRSKLESLKSKLEANNIRFGKMKELLALSKTKVGNLNESLKKSEQLVSKLKKRVVESGDQIRELESEICESAKQMEDLTEMYESKNSKYSDKIKTLNENIRSLRSEISKLESEVSEQNRQRTIISESLTKKDLEHEDQFGKLNSRHKNEIRQLKENHRSDLEKLSEKYELRISDIERSHSSEIEALKRENSELESQVSKALFEKSSLETSAKSNKDSMSRKLAEARKQISRLTDDYIVARCAQEGISVESVKGTLKEGYTKSDIDKKILEMSDQKRRMNKLPIVMRQPVTATLEENLGYVSDEDAQTWSILTNSIK